MVSERSVDVVGPAGGGALEEEGLGPSSVEPGRLGKRAALRFGWMANSCSVKLNRGGRGLPLGSVVAGLRNSSKKSCAHACNRER